MSGQRTAPAPLTRYNRAMPRWQLRYAIACTAIVGWALAYALAGWHQWTRLHYDPLARSWGWQRHAASPVPIDYWGLALWGAGGAALGAALALVAGRLWRRPLPPSVLTILGAWAITAFLYAGTYFTWSLWPF
jgi:hypothetical protein